jgi:hypothetical protein
MEIIFELCENEIFHSIFMQSENIFQVPFKFTRIPTSDLTIPRVCEIGTQEAGFSYQGGKLHQNHVIENKLHAVLTISEGQPTLYDGRNLQAWTIRDCGDCTINITKVIGTLYCYNLKNCTIKVLGVKGSINLTGCIDTISEAVCAQLRVTDCKHIQLRVQTLSPTTLVNSTEIIIKKPPIINADELQFNILRQAGLISPNTVEESKWKEVNDFNCLSQQSGNVVILEDS